MHLLVFRFIYIKFQEVDDSAAVKPDSKSDNSENKNEMDKSISGKNGENAAPVKVT